MTNAFSAYARYFDFQGRSTRTEFWSYMLLYTAVFLVLLFGSVLLTDDEDVSRLVLTVLVLINLIPSVSIQVRRLHDAGRSGWWTLFGIIPLIGPLTLLIMYCQPSIPVRRPQFSFEETTAPQPSPVETPAPRTFTSTSDSLPLAELERLVSLRKSGALSDDEFERLKGRLIGPTAA